MRAESVEVYEIAELGRVGCHVFSNALGALIMMCLGAHGGVGYSCLGLEAVGQFDRFTRPERTVARCGGKGVALSVMAWSEF